MALPSLNVLSLCSGVGGLDLGVEIAEPRAVPVCYVEREAAAAAILVARMEDGALAQAPIWSDLGTFDAGRWRGCVDIVTSGDPCQPNSVAGKGGGEDDDRWLIDQVLRVFEDSGAHRLFRENVTGNAHGQLAALVPALERMGCRVAAGIFAASEIGASHRRERLFIMADRFRDERAGQRLYARSRDEGRGTPDTEWGSAGLGYAQDNQRRGEQQAQGAGRRRAGSAGNGETLEHAQGLGRGEGRPQSEIRWGRHAAAGDGNALAHPGGAGSQGRGFAEQERRREFAHGFLPLHAPGPANPEWLRIFAEFPEILPSLSRYDRLRLAMRYEGYVAVGAPGEGVWRRNTQEPSISAASLQEAIERSLRRVADGLDVGLDLSWRVDRIRACGNGVVPLQAAYAYRTLDALLRAGADEPFLMVVRA